MDSAKPGDEVSAKAADRTARLSAITAAIDKVGTELGKVYDTQRNDAAAVAATKDSPYAYKGIDFSNQTASSRPLWISSRVRNTI
ncbi:hypothetical protein [Tunturiibacter gelidiferens]|uniref:hypothetical protein n=1 Tax=Tunturiibacter gelidiferens TaxID=3069689 RepID=UPI003D9B30CF